MKDGFPRAARAALADTQLRRNLGHATRTIRDKRARVVAEVPDWEALRDAGAAIKDRALRHLDVHLERLEESVQRAGGMVHWARDGAEANRDRRPTSRGPTAPTRSSRSSRWPPTRSTSTTRSRRAASRGGDRPRRADRPALRRHVLAHPRPGHPPQPRRDRRAVPARAGRRGLRRSRRADRGGAAPPAREVPLGAGRRQRRQLRGRRDRARRASSSPRATGACARRCPRCSSPSWASRRSCRAGATSRSCSSCCRAPRRASG